MVNVWGEESFCSRDELELIQLIIFFIFLNPILWEEKQLEKNHRGLVKAFYSLFRQALSWRVDWAIIKIVFA